MAKTFERPSCMEESLWVTLPDSQKEMWVAFTERGSTITINGKELPSSQCVIIRVALIEFRNQLASDKSLEGWSDFVVKGWHAQCEDILNTMEKK